MSVAPSWTQERIWLSCGLSEAFLRVTAPKGYATGPPEAYDSCILRYPPYSSAIAPARARAAFELICSSFQRRGACVIAHALLIARPNGASSAT
jgi:hypothetical protein